MEWANRLLTQQPSSRATKQLNVSSTTAARSATIDDLNSHNVYHHDRNDANGCQATASTGNSNRNTTLTTTTTSSTMEHRTTSTGAPVRTVSISRSGRYKSKSKQRARLLSGEVDHPSSTTVTNASHILPPFQQRFQEMPHHGTSVTPSHSCSTAAELVISSSSSPSILSDTVDGRLERNGSSTIGNHNDRSTSSQTTSIDAGSGNHVTIPYYHSAVDDDDDSGTAALQIAFESTNL